jgi:hypothetical protein
VLPGFDQVLPPLAAVSTLQRDSGTEDTAKSRYGASLETEGSAVAERSRFIAFLIVMEVILALHLLP